MVGSGVVEDLLGVLGAVEAVGFPAAFVADDLAVGGDHVDDLTVDHVHDGGVELLELPVEPSSQASHPHEGRPVSRTAGSAVLMATTLSSQPSKPR